VDLISQCKFTVIDLQKALLDVGFLSLQFNNTFTFCFSWSLAEICSSPLHSPSWLPIRHIAVSSLIVLFWLSVFDLLLACGHIFLHPLCCYNCAWFSTWCHFCNRIRKTHHIASICYKLSRPICSLQFRL